MTTIPLVLLLATAAFGYRQVGIVDIKSLETSTKSDVDNDISNEPSYGGNENQNGYIGNTEDTINFPSKIDPSADTEILTRSEGQLATGCFGVPEAVPAPTVNNDLDQITFPDPPLVSYAPIPPFNDRNTFTPPFPQMPPRYNQLPNRPFMPPPPMFQGMPFHHRPPPLVIVKMLQPIILPVVKVVPELTTPVPDYEDIETNQLTNGRYRGRRFDGRRMYNRMPFERLVGKPIIKTDDTMHFSVKVY